MRDPYEVLDVPRSASRVEIKTSFRRLAKELHPDVNKNDTTVAITELNAAYDILGDKKKRKAFDRGKIDAAGRPTSREISLKKTRRSMKGLVIVVALAAISALIIDDLTLQRKIHTNGDRKDASSPRSEPTEQRTGAQRSERIDDVFPSAPHIILQPGDLRASDGAIPLGLQVTGEAPGMALEVIGLPTGTTITAGRMLGAGRWRILATDVGNALVAPPEGFSGTLEFAVELRLADDTVVDSGHFRLQVSPGERRPNESAGEAAVSGASGAKVTTASPPTERDAIHDAKELSADRGEIELLIERGQKLISEGEVATARLLLQPIAEAGDARAALALGATYDPIMLTKLRTHGVAADAALAREWYKKAGELGSQEAQERLKLLAASAVSNPEVGRNVAEKNIGTPMPPVKPRKHIHGSTNRAPASPDDPNGVYVAGERVGSDPDPNIRSQLFRDDAGRELRTDMSGRQLLREPAPGAR